LLFWCGPSGLSRGDLEKNRTEKCFSLQAVTSESHYRNGWSSEGEHCYFPCASWRSGWPCVFVLLLRRCGVRLLRW
jgi:hypothetical protein